jgi:hypothetical protein
LEFVILLIIPTYAKASFYTLFSVSLNAFSIVLAPFITISTNHVSATAGTAITPVTITNTGDAVSIKTAVTV